MRPHCTTFCDKFQCQLAPETFMTDGGRHFDNAEVEELCKRWGSKHHVVAAYSPWVNGLVEGANKILLYVLAHLCALEIGEDGWRMMVWDNIPRSWPDHCDKAIQIMNWRILPVLKFQPKEILLGLVVNMEPMPIEVSAAFVTPPEIDVHMVYTTQQWLDSYNEVMQHAMNCKWPLIRK